MESLSSRHGFNKPQLALHEWLAVMVIIGALTSLTLLSLLNSTPAHKEGVPHYLKPQEIEVFVQGAVAAPGSYKVPVGTKFHDLIALAQPLEGADLKRFKSRNKLRNGQVITVPEIAKVTVFLTGAVEAPGKISIPRGTRLLDLPKYIQLKSDADGRKINQKRVLKDNETIHIPSKIGL